MDWSMLHTYLLIIQHSISVFGILIIFSGVLIALGHYIIYISGGKVGHQPESINLIRMQLGRTLILGLEFIVAADLIGSTTTPDYYAVGLLAIIVVIRTFLTWSLNRELTSLRTEMAKSPAL